jgi:hypothetical protein
MYRILLDLANSYKSDTMSIEILENSVCKRLVTEEEEERARIEYEQAADNKEQARVDEINKHFEAEVTVISKVPLEERQAPGQQIAKPTEVGTIVCSTCDTEFTDRKLFKQHYKSEWHVENTKRKTQGKDLLSEDAFYIWREEEIDNEMFGNKSKEKHHKKKKRGKDRGKDF